LSQRRLALFAFFLPFQFYFIDALLLCLRLCVKCELGWRLPAGWAAGCWLTLPRLAGWGQSRFARVSTGEFSSPLAQRQDGGYSHPGSMPISSGLLSILTLEGWPQSARWHWVVFHRHRPRAQPANHSPDDSTVSREGASYRRPADPAAAVSMCAQYRCSLSFPCALSGSGPSPSSLAGLESSPPGLFELVG
jgi:hypothetical protein